MCGESSLLQFRVVIHVCSIAYSAWQQETMQDDVWFSRRLTHAIMSGMSVFGGTMRGPKFVCLSPCCWWPGEG